MLLVGHNSTSQDSHAAAELHHCENMISCNWFVVEFCSFVFTVYSVIVFAIVHAIHGVCIGHDGTETWHGRSPADTYTCTPVHLVVLCMWRCKCLQYATALRHFRVLVHKRAVASRSQPYTYVLIALCRHSMAWKVTSRRTVDCLMLACPANNTVTITDPSAVICPQPNHVTHS